MAVATLVLSLLLSQNISESQSPDALQLLTDANAAYAKTDCVAARRLTLRALELFERAADRDGIGRANHQLGLCADLEGEKSEAADRYAKAMAAFDATGNTRGRMKSTQGFLRSQALEPDEASRLLERTLEDARTVGDKVAEGQLLHHRGDTRFAEGSYALALEDLEKAATLLEAGGARTHLGTVYNSMGRLYRAHGQLESALAFQLKALAIHEVSDTSYFYLQSLNAVAVTYDALGDGRSAAKYYKRALELAEKTTSSRIQDFIRANLAEAMASSGENAEETARLLEGIIARGADAYPSLRYRTLSRVYVKLGRLDEALAAAENSVVRCGADLDCMYALSTRAAVRSSRGENDAALADVRDALARLEAVRSKLVPADFFKQEFNLAQEFVYSQAIALQLRQGQETTALETAELARARAFIDLLASRDLQPRQQPVIGVPLVFRGSALPSAAAATPATIGDLIATSTRLRSTLLVYWVSTDAVFAWVVTPTGKVHVARTAVSIAVLRGLLRSTNRAGVKTWRDLYDLLIKPVRAYLPRAPGARLTIVPHGPLAALPFAALQDAQGRYLLEDYTLHYAPAGAMLDFTAAKRHTDSRRGDVLLVADPVLPKLSSFEQPLPRLVGARDETRAIGTLLTRKHVTLLEGARADENAVRAAASGKAVLHFATHAIVRDGDPFSSFLAVARPSAGDADGLLTAQEIYGLNLDADIVVLSACHSAGGRVTGDGIATFARAFIYAGAPSIVASLWEVADEPTNGLIRDFYRAWLGGASKAAALRQAQLRLLRELRSGSVRIDSPAGLVVLPEHPLLWAGFVLIGEPD